MRIITTRRIYCDCAGCRLWPVPSLWHLGFNLRSGFTYFRRVDGVEDLEPSSEVILVVLHLGNLSRRNRPASRQNCERVIDDVFARRQAMRRVAPHGQASRRHFVPESFYARPSLTQTTSSVRPGTALQIDLASLCLSRCAGVAKGTVRIARGRRTWMPLQRISRVSKTLSLLV